MSTYEPSPHTTDSVGVDVCSSLRAVLRPFGGSGNALVEFHQSLLEFLFFTDVSPHALAALDKLSGERDTDPLPAATPAAVETIDDSTIIGLRQSLAAFRQRVASGRVPADAGQLRRLIGELEQMAAALAGLQMQAIVAFDLATREANAAKGVPPQEQGRGVGRAVALATRCSPHRGARLLATAKTLTSEMPHLFAGLCTGRLSAFHTQIAVDEGRKLPSPQRRALFDKRLAEDLAAIETLGPKSLRRRAQALVDELHPASAAERFAEEARASCYVELEELGAGMSRLSATMPTPHAAYIYTVLEATAADLPVAAHDPATGRDLLPRGQAMTQALYQQFAPNADCPSSGVQTPASAQSEPTPTRWLSELPRSSACAEPVEASLCLFAPPPAARVSPSPNHLNRWLKPGRLERPSKPPNAATSPKPPNRLGVVPITIDLVISDKALLGYGQEPATVLTGGANRNCGPIPAAIARALIANALDAQAQTASQPLVWLRKLYVNDHGNLIATSSRQRFHPEGLATMLRLRDQGVCRTPWCDAPIRHADHVIPWSRGGKTTLGNSAGQCVRCNQTKDAPGWQATAGVDSTTGGHQITYIEPTGQKATSHPPKLPTPAW